MEQERRRLAILCSHLDPSRQSPHDRRPESIEASAASSSDDSERAKGDDGKEDNNSCVFCKIIRGESPAFKLYEDDTCLCILDSNPLTHGHSLIITKCHFPSLDATPPHVVAAMCSNVPFLSNAIMQATQSDSFNLLVNSGSAAGQVIFHTHFHIIPRKAGDNLWPSENSRRRPIRYNQDTVVLVDCIKAQLSSANDNCINYESMLPKN